MFYRTIIIIIVPIAFCSLPGGEKSAWPSSIFHSENNVKLRQDYSNFGFVVKAQNVQSYLRNLANKQMAVTAFQSLFDNLKFRETKVDVDADLKSKSWSISSLLGACKSGVLNAMSMVSKSYDSDPVDMIMFRHYKQCCHLKQKNTRYDWAYDSYVNLSMSCDIIPQNLSPFVFYPGPHLTKTLTEISRTSPATRWQYFISRDGAHLEYPAHFIHKNATKCIHNENTRHLKLFVATALPYNKRVVILIENGLSMRPELMKVAKDTAKLIVKSMWHTDQVAILALSNMTNSPCANKGGFMNVTQANARMFNAFIDTLPINNGATNHSLGFIDAFNLFDQRNDTTSQNLIIYLSRGLLSSLQEAGKVMSTILKLNLKQQLNVQINTLPVINRGKVPLWELQFMKDLAIQNYSKYNNSIEKSLLVTLNATKIKPPKGMMKLVNNTGVNYGFSLTQMVELLRRPGKYAQNDRLLWSKVHSDPTVKGWRNNILSVSVAVWQSDTFVGVVGMDFSVDALAIILQYSIPANHTHQYFIVDLQGDLVWHPKLKNGMVISVEKVEQLNEDDFMHFINLINQKESGKLELLANQTSQIQWRWQKIGSFPFVLVRSSLVLDNEMVLSLDTQISGMGLDLVTYHRLDLRINSEISKYCLNGRQLSSTERGSVYLSASCFHNPFDRLARSETRSRAAGLWAHLGSKLIKNPGLKHGIKDDVSALSGIVGEWRRLHEASPMKYSILRRFAASPNGVMVSFPAGVLPPDYDPTKRAWFTNAMERKGEIFVSSPYLDPSGLGYVVTISQAIYEGKHASLHHPSDTAAAVIAIDVPLSFMHKLVREALPICLKREYNCLLLDGLGYVVGHALKTPSPPLAGREPQEGQHVTRVLPLLAADLLQHKYIIRKELCIQFGPGISTLQRIYSVNISCTQVIKQDDQTHGCTVFSATSVPRTNTMLIIANASCNHQQAAFCPCSVLDRKCLNCFRCDSLECECPCECSLHENVCPESANDVSSMMTSLSDVPCPAPQSTFHSLPHISPGVMADLAIISNSHNAHAGESILSDSLLPDCTPIHCQKHAILMLDCLGLIACQWCYIGENGEYLNGESFCAPIGQCFGGVRGRSPEGLIAYTNESMVVSTPVGPVAGAIITVFIILCLAVYCYRNQVTRLVEGRSSSCGSGARLNVCGSDVEYEFDHSGSSDVGSAQTQQHDSVLLASFERHAPQPQFPIQRPNTDSSDHGYSTMTGNCDDSEHATSVDLITPAIRRNKLILRQAPLPGKMTNILNSKQIDNEKDILLKNHDVTIKESDVTIDGMTSLDTSTVMTSLNDSSMIEDTNTVTIQAQVHAIDCT